MSGQQVFARGAVSLLNHLRNIHMYVNRGISHGKNSLTKADRGPKYFPNARPIGRVLWTDVSMAI